MTYETLISSISFSNEKEKDSFASYYPIRGLGVYCDTLRTLEAIIIERPIPYSLFSGLIRYDKQLRDTIYQYVAALEEYWRNHLCYLCEYRGTTAFYKVDNKNEQDFTRLIGDEYFGWNLYRNPTFDFGSMLRLYRKFDFAFPKADACDRSQISQIKDLRNLVMHHRMLTVNQSESKSTRESVINYRNKIETLIKGLIKLLPNQYQTGLKKDLLKCNHDKKNNTIKSPHLNFDNLGEE
jgi:hypothetical protein